MSDLPNPNDAFDFVEGGEQAVRHAYMIDPENQQRLKGLVFDGFCTYLGIDYKNIQAPFFILIKKNDRLTSLWYRIMNIILINGKEDLKSGIVFGEEVSHHIRGKLQNDTDTDEEMTDEFFGYLGRRLMYHYAHDELGEDCKYMFPDGEPNFERNYSQKEILRLIKEKRLMIAQADLLTDDKSARAQSADLKSWIHAAHTQEAINSQRPWILIKFRIGRLCTVCQIKRYADAFLRTNLTIRDYPEDGRNDRHTREESRSRSRKE